MHIYKSNNGNWEPCRPAQSSQPIFRRWDWHMLYTEIARLCYWSDQGAVQHLRETPFPNTQLNSSDLLTGLHVNCKQSTEIRTYGNLDYAHLEHGNTIGNLDSHLFTICSDHKTYRRSCELQCVLSEHIQYSLLLSLSKSSNIKILAMQHNTIKLFHKCITYYLIM